MKIFVVTATSLCDAECPVLATSVFYRTREEAEAVVCRLREENRKEVALSLGREDDLEDVLSTFEVEELTQG